MIVPSGMVTSVRNWAISHEEVAVGITGVEEGARVGGGTVVTTGKVAGTAVVGANCVSWACRVCAAAVEVAASFASLLGRLQDVAARASPISRLKTMGRLTLRMDFPFLDCVHSQLTVF
jgi:hypothetical protein